MKPTTPPAGSEMEAALHDMGPADDSHIEEDLLVEDVSIDGMCGVY